MNKIGNRLLVLYSFIFFIAFAIAAFALNNFTRQYLINETKQQLRHEGEIISRYVVTEKYPWKYLWQKVAIMNILGRTVKSEIVIMSNTGDVVYQDLKTLHENDIIEYAKNINNEREVNIEGYISEVITIDDLDDLDDLDDVDDKIDGYVILMTKEDTINYLNKITSQTQLIAFLISGVLTVIIGIFYSRSLTKPLKKLTNKMENFSISNDYSQYSIKTGDEIEELDKSFSNMAMKIKKYDIQQRNFFQNTSHELKTPLMTIQGYVEAIRDGVVGEDEMQESLEIVISESQRLKEIVNNLIYLTKLENSMDNLVLEKIKLHQFINNVIRRINLIGNSQKITIELDIDESIFVYIDNEKFYRALINILTNNLRYASSHIMIKAKDNDDATQILIVDDGPGLEEGEEEKVFLRFYKGKKGNTGIGLAITKAIIEAHGGKVSAYNNKPRGVVFRISLPKRKER